VSLLKVVVRAASSCSCFWMIGFREVVDCSKARLTECLGSHDAIQFDVDGKRLTVSTPFGVMLRES
jgi:hypothetical protein